MDTQDSPEAIPEIVAEPVQATSPERPVPQFPEPGPKPAFDYINWPFAPRTGHQTPGNKKFQRQSLFIETCDVRYMRHVKWTLQEHEVWNPWVGVWVPSAWLCIVNAIDDYDAMRKIVGSPKHWDVLHKFVWFQEWLDECLREQAAFQRMAVRKVLLTLAESDSSKESLPACKALLSMIDKKNANPRGRPVKTREDDQEGRTEKDVGADHARVTSLFATGAK